MIQATNLKVGYNHHILLENLNFTIQANKIYHIHGSNASGKTTLAQTLVGLIPQLGGDIQNTFKKIDYIPQKLKINLDYPLTVKDFFYLTHKQSLGFIQELLQQLKIELIFDKLLFQLSGGELQIIVLLRALLNQPDFLILDEPFNNLDINYRFLIQKLFSDKKIGLCIIDHIHQEKEIYYDYILSIKDGTLEVLPH